MTRFKKYALKYHPLKNPAQMRLYLPKFHLICESYEVLSNQQLRTIYEEYGDEGLRMGIRGPDGVYRGGYQYQENCYEIFDKFFLESNPFFDLCTDLTEVTGTNLEIEGSYFGTAYRGLAQPLPEPAEDINVVVDVTLEELYNGSRKTVSYKKQVLGLDGRTLKTQQAEVIIYVKPGMSCSKKMTLPREGNQQAKMPATNLNISFKQVKSVDGSNASRYERKNNDLIYRHTLSLNDALQCRPVKLTTLDGRTLFISLDEIPSPGYVKQIEGEGMVIYDETSVGTQDSRTERGNLFILFDVEFPKKLGGPDRRQELIQALTAAV